MAHLNMPTASFKCKRQRTCFILIGLIYNISFLLVFDIRLIQHWVGCMQVFIYNICGFNKASRR